MRRIRFLMLAMVLMASTLLSGCEARVATQSPGAMADLPLFTNSDGYASLTVQVIDARRGTQAYSDVLYADTIRFTLTNSTYLASDKIATASKTPSSLNLFKNLRPGPGYQLHAQLYAQSRLSSPNQGNISPVVMGDGWSSIFTLNAGSTNTVTIKINGVDSNLQVVSSNNGNLFGNSSSGFWAVGGDKIVLNTGANTTNAQQASRVEAAFHVTTVDGSVLGTPPSTTVGATDTMLPWDVPTVTSDTPGYLCINILDSSGTQIAQKYFAMTIYAAGSISSIDLN